MGLKSNVLTRPCKFAAVLKSDQNGIEIRTKKTNTTKDLMLKSDQNGIEISGMSGLTWRAWILLKSDQNGIEIHLQESRAWCEPRVKIRPKWD